MAFLIYQNIKNQFIQLIPSWDTANFRVVTPEWLHPFLTMPPSIFFDSLLISMDLYHNAKKQSFLSFCSRDIVNLKILQSDWLTAFWPKSQEPDFSWVSKNSFRPESAPVSLKSEKSNWVRWHTIKDCKNCIKVLGFTLRQYNK